MLFYRLMCNSDPVPLTPYLLFCLAPHFLPFLVSPSFTSPPFASLILLSSTHFINYNSQLSYQLKLVLSPIYLLSLS